jgi:DNA-binding PadR family transcriptional regulator
MGYEVSELGRFSDPALFVLVSLAGGEKHGYAMMEDIERTCGTRLGPGTLYGALSRLEKRGLVEPRRTVRQAAGSPLPANVAGSLRGGVYGAS